MRAFVWAIIAIAGFIFMVRYIENRSVFFPMKELFTDPKTADLPYENIYFKAPDGVLLHGWFIPKDHSRFTVIFCHGNAGNISHRIDKISILHGLGLSVFVFDYRGYGKSKGSPNERGLYNDAQAAYSYLVNERGVKPEKIILYGESIGAAVAVDLAAKKKVKGLIVEEAFTSIREMAHMAFPMVPYFIFSSRFDSLSKIGRLACHKLFIHSVDDEIVPFSMGMRLFEAAGQPKRMVKIRGSHNTAFLNSRETFTSGIEAFLEKIS